ncbi:MAG: hypothetical protein JW708_07385 [Vallitaleaceae bacterium]|nr:hypothetical protein [Vallitaleaceae bacterium]
MVKIYYYMTLFPTESLIASNLDPEKFGAYMATGSKSGSHEQLIFAEVVTEFGSDFDWDYARIHTVPNQNEKLKNSAYLSIYRVLERMDLNCLGNLYLVTSDGLTLTLEKGEFPSDSDTEPYYLYQDLCPVTPLVVSSLPPMEYGKYMVSDSIKISLPAICYCDLKVIDINHPVHTGNIGSMYDHNLNHLNECIKVITEKGKKTKMLERTFAGRFTYQIVRSGFAIVNSSARIWYNMPSPESLVERNYDWARSAMII